ncbi:transducin/WD40 repeat-like superfamily protein [Striga asiatica]|uniref:Transducin/WD40 repeat-like superfamily protein n=1 Tax=Striga asiatica TaxID=4170 RepID=A0A5A7Q5P5_STRAF|nr:transducin/WD40 repeat-like superfamily protein [Striga asiatica]
MATSRSGAGGKIVTNRRKQRLSTTPYDRPPPQLSPPPQPKSPNWFTGVVVPSARFLVSGAGKILSSIFSDSESSSSEDDESASDDDIGNENLHEILYSGVNTSNEESQLNTWSSDTKWTIEQLILQETFSREECDKLIKVLNSRVTVAGEKNLPAEKTVDNEDIDMYSKAIQEAKKWFQDKKVGSSSVAELAHEISNINSGHVETGGGSPVDVARSYMKDRPPWTSPTKSVDLRTPLRRMELFKEGALYSVGQDSLSSSNKRSSISGSWNILEELRRVRSKATEDMLRTPPSKVDPLFAVGQNKVDSSGAGLTLFGMGEKISDTDSSRETKRADAGVSSEPNPAGPSPHSTNGVPSTEMAEAGEKLNANDPSPSQPSFPAGQNSEKHEETNNSFNTENGHNSSDTFNVEGEFELLNEVYIEVPIITETDSMAIGSQNSLGLQYEELALDTAQLYSEDEKVAGKPQMRKSGRNIRRGRGRGK